MSSKYTNKIHDIAVSTFEITCFMFPLEEWEVDETGVIFPRENVRSIVQFDGAAKGGMVINPSRDLLEGIAANMLGLDEVDDEIKEGALCEIANIICGNTVPLFAKNKQICYIRPPRIAEPMENTDQLFEEMQKEVIRVFFDEGAAEITIYYSLEEAA